MQILIKLNNYSIVDYPNFCSYPEFGDRLTNLLHHPCYVTPGNEGSSWNDRVHGAFPTEHLHWVDTDGEHFDENLVR